MPKSRSSPQPSPVSAPPDRLVAAVLAAALRRVEEAGPLDDQALLRRALAAGGDRAQQIARRNAWLAERLGLQQELTRWRQLALLLVLVLAALMALAGLATARSVLAPDRSINAVAAMVGVLALPTLTLLAWLAMLVAAHRGADTGAWSFGRLVLALAARLPLGRGAHAPQLLQALLEVMQRQRLWSWFSGVVSHAIWLLALLLTVIVLVFGFSFQAYRLSWETTILSAGFFQWFVAASGWLPHLLGFAIPDAAAIQQVGHAAAAPELAAQRAWAWWLMGCIVVYGALPRLLLLGLSVWRWYAGLGRVAAVDMSDPYNHRLLRRLDALAPASQVLDPESAGAIPRPPWARSDAEAGSGTLAVIGFELPDELRWPVPDLPPALAHMLRVDGSSDAVRQVLQQLDAAPPAAVLVVVHAAASPDRGTARFLHEVTQRAVRCAVLAADPDGGIADADAMARWHKWLSAQDLPPCRLLPQAADAAHWLEDDHA